MILPFPCYNHFSFFENEHNCRDSFISVLVFLDVVDIHKVAVY